MTVISLVQGIQSGLSLTTYKRLEDSVRAGEHNYAVAMLQTATTSTALLSIDLAIQAAGRQPLSLVGRYAAIYLPPVLLAGLKDTRYAPPAFLQDQLSNFYQTASIISSFSLLYFSQPFFAIPYLLILGIGFMERNGLLSVAFRQFWQNYTMPVQILTSLAVGSAAQRALVAFDLFSWCINEYFSYRKQTAVADFTVQQNLSFEMLDGFFGPFRQYKYKINQKYIHYNPLPPIPQIDIQKLVESFDQLGAEHLLTLRKKLQRDDRFIAKYSDPKLKETNELPNKLPDEILNQIPDKEIFDFARNSLQEFVSSVKERRVLNGEPRDYEKLHNYLRIIAKHVEEKSSEINRADILFRLAVEGGEYCGPGKFEVSESVYTEIVCENPEVPFTDKILHCLQDERKSWAMKHYENTARKPLLRWIADVHDLHNYNRYVNDMCDQLGLRKAAADNDEVSKSPPIMKLGYFLLFQPAMNFTFWQDHTVDAHAKILAESIGTHRLPKPEFYAFWQNWIERQDLTDEQKEVLQENLGNGFLGFYPRKDPEIKQTLPINLGNVPPPCFYQVERKGQINPDLIELMLFDMGIIEENKV